MTTGKWVSKANIPSQRSNPASCSYNGEMYVFGGHYISPISTCYAYNPTTDTWRQLTNMPTARYDASTCVVGDKIYVLGGHNGEGIYYAKNEVYEPSTNTWITATDIPTPREDLGVVSYSGKIYAIGGANGNYLNKVECYDVAGNTWSTLADMPTARNSFGLAEVNGKIHVVGGLNSDGILDKHEVYDIATNTWTTLKSIYIRRRHCKCVNVGGSLFVLGGYNDSSNGNINDISLNLVEMYDSVNNQWIKKASMLNAKDRFAVGVINNKIYISTGWSNGWYTNTTAEFNLSDTSQLVVDGINANIPLPELSNKKDNIDYLRQTVNEFRVYHGLQEVVWTDASIIRNVTRIKAIHWNELANAVKEVYTTYGMAITDVKLNEVIMANNLNFKVTDLGQRINSVVKALNKNI